MAKSLFGFIYCFAILFPLLLVSQENTKHWYFGNRAGILFEGDNVSILENSVMQAFESCDAVTDENGELLFYTNGIEVFNKNHALMSNGDGLSGGFSSTQVIVIPKPGDPQRFYIFTVDDFGGEDGLRYSEVDMSLNSGLGAVTGKNVLLTTPVTEKITAIYNWLEDYYWLLTRKWDSEEFYAYKITRDGIDTNPVVSDVDILVGLFPASGSVLPDFDLGRSGGQLKFSPNGNLLASAQPVDNFFKVFSFDRINGTVSNPLILYNNPNIENYDRSAYGVEFSPNSQYVYFSESSGGLFQYDLAAGSLVDIINSKVELNNDDTRRGALQLAPNDKIYVANPGANGVFLDVIHSPNSPGLNSDFQPQGQPIGGIASSFGLPNRIHSFSECTINVTSLCFGDMASFSTGIVRSYDSILWDFGDGSFSSLEAPLHQYTSPGTYVVKVEVLINGELVTNTTIITISETPSASQAPEISVCDEDNDGFYNFDLTEQASIILADQNPDLFEFKYYNSEQNLLNDIPIETPEDYQNLESFNQEEIFCKISNLENKDCQVTTSFFIRVFRLFEFDSALTVLDICDDNSIGTDSDGLVITDLTEFEALLSQQDVSEFQFKYFKDSDLIEQIANPETYANSSANEVIYVEAVNINNTSCIAIGAVNLVVHSIPEGIEPWTVYQCDDDLDGFSIFNLTNIKEDLFSVYDTAAMIVFYESLEDAMNATNSISNETAYENNTVNGDVIWAEVKNEYGCNRFVEVDLNVTTTQIPIDFIRDFKVCDDIVDGDSANGISNFDFSEVNEEILSLFPEDQLIQINYYRTAQDALLEIDPILDISNYRNIGYPFSQNIYVRVDSEVNRECLSLGHHITLTVQGVPSLNMADSYVLCEGNDLTVEADPGYDSYEWSTGETTRSISIDAPGVYTVTVSTITEELICSVEKTINVSASSLAQIINIETTDWSFDSNSIMIMVSGLGDYEYSLDNISFQDTNVFSDIVYGDYVVYVRDKNGCGLIEKEVSLLYYPRFFTPNGDGQNDNWSIFSSEARDNPSVLIFDRFGKLLKRLNSSEPFWDGTFNGEQMPANDYWFVFERSNGNRYTGHFALKR